MKPTLLIVLLGLLAGCGADQRQPTRAAGADTVRMELDWTVAPGEHPAADSLGYLTGVAVDHDENVYVSDRLASKLWVFAADGGLLGSIGGEGEGPGEFVAPTGPSVGPDGRLYVRDVQRVTVFGPDEASGLLSRVETTFSGPTYPDWTSTRTTRFDSSGAMLYPGQRWQEDDTATQYVVCFVSGEATDSILAPSYANGPPVTAHHQTGPGGGRMLFGLNHVPFAVLPVWDVFAGSAIVSGDGRTYRLVVTDFAGLVQDTLGRSVEPVVLPRCGRAEPTPYLSRSLVVGLATHPLTDEHIVMRFSLGDPGSM